MFLVITKRIKIPEVCNTLRCLLIASTKFSVLEGACIWLVLILAILQVGCLSEIQEYIPVDGNFEDGTTAILREIGQDSDSPDSDSGSEMELESQHVRASLVPSH